MIKNLMMMKMNERVVLLSLMTQLGVIQYGCWLVRLTFSLHYMIEH